MDLPLLRRIYMCVLPARIAVLVENGLSMVCHSLLLLLLNTQGFSIGASESGWGVHTVHFSDSPAHEKNPRSSRDCVPCHADEPLLRAIISLDYIPTGGYTILLRIVYGVHGIHGVRGRPAIDAISR
ncbi:hypothetical protein I7I53_09819 [Histoplasma capsulatum var. duboisii H88]|uniref:Uncharacterized protein n=1 Tax=Ajellomyces capsulatus (strain H88) TaxID=544711 RepID=A0A8A1LAI8_AJEC8|nr:hypothetical protein I7I53_09819 [Histoplasma capsulatum var. duboisii H88]